MNRAIGVLISALLSLPTAADDSETVGKQIQDQVGWHTVREGESFQTITMHYLGTPALWLENVELNPEIADPGLLRPGQRIRVIVERRLPARSALIEEIANDVDKSRQRAGWEEAEPGDQLAPKDGVRTRESSSARLGFDDGSRLTLTELSQVFLKDLETTVTGVRRGSIEIEKGQAELLLSARQARLVDVEIVVGESIARPRPGPAGSAQTRSRRPEDGGAQLMVYGGSSRLEAGGATVEVARGMGSNVPDGGTPSPPEKLLPAPAPSSPSRRARFDYANPRFAWRPVAGAAAYLLEVCRDPDCGRLVRRAAGLTEATWHPEDLPAGELYWRVSAVSPSGLDGYPSRAVPFAVDSAVPDLEPPVVVAALAGAGHVAQDGTLILGRGAVIRLEGRDDASGVAEIRFRWDEGSWRRWRGDDLTLADGVYEATLAVDAIDQLGRRATAWKVRVERDRSAPAAPSVGRSRGAGRPHPTLQ